MSSYNAPTSVIHTRGLISLLFIFLASSSICFIAVTATPPDIDLDHLLQLPILPPERGSRRNAGLRPGPSEGKHEFTLRHIFHHGIYDHPNLHARLDVTPDIPIWSRLGGSPRERPSALYARSQLLTVERLLDRRPSVVEPLLAASRENGIATVQSPSAWAIENIAGPNVTDKETILNFARMASNAYETDPSVAKWKNVSSTGFNLSNSFGWESDGLQGHIFADSTNSTIVISIKGTTTAVFDGAGTTTNDKVNDNLFFSCCCAQGGQYFWRQVCDCKTTTYTCNETCVVKALREENRYYRASLDLYANVTALYPNTDVWLTGHSLGGSVSSLLGLTYGLPAVTFEAPPQALAATRLGLPSPPGSDPQAPQNRKMTGIHHFGHTADPIFMGVCNGVTSVCSIGGYAMETVCHSGNRCVYDVVADKGWRSGISTHSIASVIKDVIEAYDTVPECELDEECIDCYNWKYFNSNGSTSTTSTSPSSTMSSRTRTSTCQTPGWWGCLDQTSTSSSSATSSTTPSSASSITTPCRSYGWFGGCLDPTSTLKLSATPQPPRVSPSPTWAPSTSSTRSCNDPGFFGGCNDPTTTTTTTSSSSSAQTSDCRTPGLFWGCYDLPATSRTYLITTITSTPSSARTIECRTPGLFWGCYDLPATSRTHPITAPPTTLGTVTSQPLSSTCTSKAWFGLICLDSTAGSDQVPVSTATSNLEEL